MLNEVKEFLNMGGYAAYVWSAYGITLTVIIINLYKVLKHKRKVIREIRENNNEGPS